MIHAGLPCPGRAEIVGQCYTWTWGCLIQGKFGALFRQKIKEIMAFNATLDHFDLIDTYRAFHLKTAYYTFSQVHMEHFSEYITY